MALHLFAFREAPSELKPPYKVKTAEVSERHFPVGVLAVKRLGPAALKVLDIDH